MPESPKFLLTIKKYDECRQVMTIIGRINGKKNEFDGKFDREIMDAEKPHRVNFSDREVIYSDQADQSSKTP